MAIKVAISNQKGGVAKSTTALCMADALRHKKKSVLFIDLDSQCNSTSVYQAQIDDAVTAADLLKKRATTKEAIQETRLGSIIAGDPVLASIAPELDKEMYRYELLKDALAEVENEYDYIIMDTPPGEGIYMLNAFFAADGVIIPLTGEQFAVDGLAKIINTINEVKRHGNPDLKIYGVLMNKYDQRNKLDKEMWQSLPKIGEKIGFKVFKTPIRICQEIKNTQAHRESLFDKSPSSKAAEDYSSFVKEFMKETK